MPVTLLHVPRHVITQTKTTEKDGYDAVVVDVIEGDKVVMKKELNYTIEELEQLSALSSQPLAESNEEWTVNNEQSEENEKWEIKSENEEAETTETTETTEDAPEEKKEETKTETDDWDSEEEEEVASAPKSDSPYIGTEIPLAILTQIESVEMTGVSKGKGFTGAMKRWNFKWGPGAHGSKFHRALGSIGTRKPRRTKPGKKMHGRHGSLTKTLKSVPIEHVDEAGRIIALRGAVPGGRNSYVHLKF